MCVSLVWAPVCACHLCVSIATSQLVVYLLFFCFFFFVVEPISPNATNKKHQIRIILACQVETGQKPLGQTPPGGLLLRHLASRHHTRGFNASPERVKPTSSRVTPPAICPSGSCNYHWVIALQRCRCKWSKSIFNQLSQMVILIIFIRFLLPAMFTMFLIWFCSSFWLLMSLCFTSKSVLTLLVIADSQKDSCIRSLFKHGVSQWFVLFFFWCFSNLVQWQHQ